MAKGILIPNFADAAKNSAVLVGIQSSGKLLFARAAAGKGKNVNIAVSFAEFVMRSIGGQKGIGTGSIVGFLPFNRRITGAGFIIYDFIEIVIVQIAILVLSSRNKV